MLKKGLILVGAVVAIAALSPAIASATWFMEGKALTKNESVQFKGTTSIEGETGGFNCKVVLNGTLESGTTTGQTQWAIDGTPAAACNAQGLLALAGCTVSVVQVTSLPWTIHKSSTQSTSVTSGAVHTTWIKHNGTKCTPHTITLNAAAPNIQIGEAEMNAINKGTVSGALQSSIGEVEVTGSGNITPAGTFGL